MRSKNIKTTKTNEDKSQLNFNFEPKSSCTKNNDSGKVVQLNHYLSSKQKSIIEQTLSQVKSY